ncbi:P-loop containing nucleoside triphosphate hydrolases superfamily protein [Citrus sinensis]|nr:P-loop containing nucleoside triphosphate hydrolases superfamily protein [Citrus sinensis]
MDYPHHQWHFRPPPQVNSICPICSNFHFPFCPPPQPPPSYAHQNPRFPTRPGFDPIPWHNNNINPNFDRRHPLPPAYDYYGGANGFVTECDRNYNKRMRVDENNYQITSDNERRLKLIRDHGGNGAGNAPFHNTNGFNSFENRVDYNSDWQNYGPNNQPPPSIPPLPPPQQGYDNFNVQGGYLPPLPTSPPPPMPVEPPLPSPAPPNTSLFPVHATVPSSYPPITRVSSELISEESRTLPMQYPGESHLFPLRQLSPDKPKVVNALHLLKQPHRATRPDHFAIILRGLPGSGKSYIAKMLRDLEVENGGDAPRIHSMDDYFMTEVEKVEDSDVSKSSGSLRSKKPVTKMVMEYCYEPEMEETVWFLLGFSIMDGTYLILPSFLYIEEDEFMHTREVIDSKCLLAHGMCYVVTFLNIDRSLSPLQAYRSSMLKAFTRTLDEGNFTIVIVDDRNLRVADFAQFWATAKRSGYEVYILEATYKDPAGCAARNVHGFTLDDIERMAGQWEEAPTLYLQLDIKTLFHGDDLKESGIKEVEMDMDEDSDGLLAQQEKETNSIAVSITGEDPPADFPRNEKRWDAEGDRPAEVVKDLGSSKWSNDLNEDDDETSGVVKGNSNALSGLFQLYVKEGKSVHWGDQVGDTGFSIGAAKKSKMLSLVIGPGAGYNLKSNPLPKEESLSTQSTGKLKKQSAFQERLRAEHESFKAVFDRRRQRIGGLDLEEEP